MNLLKRIQGPISLLLLFAMLVSGIGALAYHVTSRSHASLFPAAPLQGTLNAHRTLAVVAVPQQVSAKPKGPMVSISTTNLIVSKCTGPSSTAAVEATRKDL